MFPEILVEKDGDRLRVILDERKIIRPFVNDAYEPGGLDGEAKAYLRERRALAKRIVQSVDLWKTMLRRVAEKLFWRSRIFSLGMKRCSPQNVGYRGRRVCIPLRSAGP